MAYKIQAGFGAGELDPALYERTTLEKYKAALKTARNVQVGKTGRLISRPGTNFGVNAYSNNSKSVLYAIPYSSSFIEVSAGKIRIFPFGGTSPTYEITDTDITIYNLDYIHFASRGTYVYLFIEGIKFKVIEIGSGTVLTDANKMYQHPAATISGSGLAKTGTGYDVEYVATYIEQGEESVISTNIWNTASAGGAVKLPINSGEKIEMRVEVTMTGNVNVYAGMKVKVYRRPANGNVFGFIGYGVFETFSGGPPVINKWIFTDYGQDADYTHQPPDLDATFFTDSTSSGVFNAKPKTGAIIQQRLLISGTTEDQAIFATRPGFYSNFTRDYPLNATSTLAFKAGSNGNAEVLRIMDAAGSVLVFTTVGIFSNLPGALTPDNIALMKRGSWVIDDRVPPLEVPGGILFVDKTTNSIVAISYDDNQASFQGQEISIFSNHLFFNKNIVSWAYQYGNVPTIWCVMSDGTVNGLTYNKEHQMAAWTRHDTSGLFESVCVVRNRYSNADEVVFSVNRNGVRTIETLADRFPSDFKRFVGCDCATTIANQPSDGDGLTGTYTITPVSPNDWSGSLTLVNSLLVFDNSAGNGAVGSVFRFFDQDGFAIDLTVTAYNSSSSVTVTPDSQFPPDEASFATLYKTYSVVTGLEHLEGKEVVVFVDGYVYGSPNNFVERTYSYTVTGGQITLEDNLRGAIITVGLPYAVDIETLDVDTVEQQPALLESNLASKIFLRVQDTRGLYVGSSFPDLDTNEGMVDPEYRTDEIPADMIGNSAQLPYSRRIEFHIPGDWKSNGRVCIRQVDPLPLEILSIIPDLEVYRR